MRVTSTAAVSHPRITQTQIIHVYIVYLYRRISANTQVLVLLLDDDAENDAVDMRSDIEDDVASAVDVSYNIKREWA